MNARWKRALGALALALASAGAGYGLRDTSPVTAAPVIPTETVEAPREHSLRVIYSLDQKRNDQELIALINGAENHIYFAIYTFTLSNVADALVAAKKRGVDVRGLVDAEQSSNSYGKPIIAKLLSAGIPVVTQKHASGNGIMHIKALVTEDAYAFGSYNWTKSATTENDEILEIGTDPAVVAIYERILLRLLDFYKGNAAAEAAATVSGGTYEYTEAAAHIGEFATVRGTLIKAHTSSSGTVFLDFCRDYKTCPFSGVIFADDAKRFGNLSRYEGKVLSLTGTISSYQGRAEIKLSDPDQIQE